MFIADQPIPKPPALSQSSLLAAYARLAPVLGWHPRSSYRATTVLSEMDSWTLAALRVRAVRAGLPVDLIDAELARHKSETAALLAASLSEILAEIRRSKKGQK